MHKERLRLVLLDKLIDELRRIAILFEVNGLALEVRVIRDRRQRNAQSFQFRQLHCQPCVTSIRIELVCLAHVSLLVSMSYSLTCRFECQQLFFIKKHLTLKSISPIINHQRRNTCRTQSQNTHTSLMCARHTPPRRAKGHSKGLKNNP